ncbi:MAG TPA: hypothetical protein VHN37_10895 [Actinomycetota bacterium]|nr:hypothetical protein [Actinomycetota bacterium]
MRVSSGGRRRWSIVALVLLVPAGLVTASAGPSFATHEWCDPADTFVQAVFVDNNGDGIGESNGVQNIGWFNGTGDFSGGEYAFSIDTGGQSIAILPAADNAGDANPVIQCSSASVNQMYQATATVQFDVLSVVRPADFWARLTIQPQRSNGTPVPNSECNTQTNISRDLPAVEPLIEVDLTLPCRMPATTAALRLKIRAHISHPAASGRLVFREVTFTRLPDAPPT